MTEKAPLVNVIAVLADVSALAGGVSGAARGVGAVADMASAGDVASSSPKTWLLTAFDKTLGK